MNAPSVFEIGQVVRALYKRRCDLDEATVPLKSGSAAETLVVWHRDETGALVEAWNGVILASRPVSVRDVVVQTGVAATQAAIFGDCAVESYSDEEIRALVAQLEHVLRSTCAFLAAHAGMDLEATFPGESPPKLRLHWPDKALAQRTAL